LYKNNDDNSSSLFLEGLVQEILFDPIYMKQQSLISDEVDDSEFGTIPANSIVFRILNDQREKEVNIAFPMFPSHLNMPLKVGEVAWIITVGSRYYWLCRKISISTIEDVNITYDSRFGHARFLETDEEADRVDNTIPTIPSPNIETFLDEEDGSDKPVYEQYITSRKTAIHNEEIVPRYTKSPGDFVLQGSNNTLISLGTDRGYSINDDLLTLEKSSAWDEKEKYSGAIDIVSGRGRYLLNNDKVTKLTPVGIQSVPDRTGTYIIENSLENFENDKTLFVNDAGDISKKQKNLLEGDPDFAYDSSRLYIASNTLPDKRFSLTPLYPKIPFIDNNEIQNAVSILESSITVASIVAKSDEIRIISRYLDHESDNITAHFPNSSENVSRINGSIKIIKEGTRDDSGHSTLDGNGSSIIAMQPDGIVMIDGSSIIIGSGRESSNNGEGNQIFLGADAIEPIVLGTQLKDLLTMFFDDLKLWLSNNFDTHTHPTGVGPSGPPVIIGNDAGTGTAKGNLDKTLSKIGKTK
jgi:hypothetical protein